MFPIRSQSLLPGLSLAIFLTPAQTTAQDVEEIVVTATRRAVSVEEVSQWISVIDKDESGDGLLVTDAFEAQTGVFLQQTTPGQGAAIVRGLKGSSILHLVDGMRLNNAIFRSAPTQYFALLPASAVEQVEVLRGSPASLYGSDAVGGAVQFVTRVPRFDTSQLEVPAQPMPTWTPQI